MGIDTTAFVHEKALAHPEAEIGAHTRVWAFANVQKGAVVGAHCNLCDGVFVEGGAVIGNYCTVKNGVAIWNQVTLGDYVFLGPHAVLTNDMAPRSHPDFRASAADWLATRIDDGASIGANATIVCGCTVGSWAFVAAGAVVTHNVPPHALVMGVPARRVGWVGKAGHRLPDTPDADGVFRCAKSNRQYRYRDAQNSESGLDEISA